MPSWHLKGFYISNNYGQHNTNKTVLFNFPINWTPNTVQEQFGFSLFLIYPCLVSCKLTCLSLQQPTMPESNPKGFQVPC